MQNVRFQVSYLHMKWGAVLQGEGCITINLQYSIPSQNIWLYFEELLIASKGLLWSTQHHFYPKTTLNFLAKCQIWGNLSAQEIGCCVAKRGMHWYLSVSKHSFLRCKRMFGRAPGSNYEPPYGSPDTTSVKNTFLMSYFRYLRRIVEGLLCCNERHPLLFECFIGFIRWI